MDNVGADWLDAHVWQAIALVAVTATAQCAMLQHEGQGWVRFRASARLRSEESNAHPGPCGHDELLI